MHVAIRRWKRSFTATSAVVVALILVLVAIWAGPAVAAAVGPRNLGFEGNLAPWIPNPAPPAVGTPVVVAAEGPGQFPVYTDMGVLTVDPWGGQMMLRLGVPKGTDSNQVKGVESVSQTFVSDGREIVVAYRLFTYDHRSGDVFDIDVKTVDRIATYYHFRAPISMTKASTHWDSGWSEVHIKGLPAGQLALSYALSNSTNAAHDTWIYVDHRNVPPRAGSVAIAPAGPTTNQTLAATPSGFTDADGDSLTYHYAWYVDGALRPLETGASLDLSVAGNGDHGDTVKVEVYATDGNGGTSGLVSATTGVANTPPTLTGVTLPADPTTDQTISAAPQGYHDTDGDGPTYQYAWYVDGALRPLETGASLDLSVAGNGDRGDTIMVEVYATDGNGGKSEEKTASVTVADSAPVADFTWAPGGPGGESPHEGDAIGLYSDLSHDPDGDALVRWEWQIEKPGQAPEVYSQSSPIGFIVPFGDGDYGVTLTVWEADGLSASSVTKTIAVQDYAPRVNALNVEVLPGGSPSLSAVSSIRDGWTFTAPAGLSCPSGPRPATRASKRTILPPSARVVWTVPSPEATISAPANGASASRMATARERTRSLLR